MGGIVILTAALAMFVTPEGDHQWRYVTTEKDPNVLVQQLSLEMGYQRLCLKGWEILRKNQVKQGRKIYVFYEGRCK